MRPGPRLAFSTLTCPAWSIAEVLAAASRDGYQGVELRALNGTLIDLSLPASERRGIKRAADEAGIAICALDSSVRLAAGGEPGAVSSELVGFLELAAAWQADLVRVFPGPWPAGRDQNRVLVAMTEIVERALPAAERLGVAIALETHDTFSSALLVGELLRRVPHPAFGAVWDIYQTHLAGETPAAALAALDGRILHVHVKDARRAPGDTGAWELVPLGTGELPVREIVEMLRDRRFSGWLAVEWPKHWQPSLAEPEAVLPQHAQVLRSWLAPTEEER